jgi:hypothetical protein
MFAPWVNLSRMTALPSRTSLSMSESRATCSNCCLRGPYHGVLQLPGRSIGMRHLHRYLGNLNIRQQRNRQQSPANRVQATPLPEKLMITATGRFIRNFTILITGLCFIQLLWIHYNYSMHFKL